MSNETDRLKELCKHILAMYKESESAVIGMTSGEIEEDKIELDKEINSIFDEINGV